MLDESLPNFLDRTLTHTKEQPERQRSAMQVSSSGSIKESLSQGTSVDNSDFQFIPQRRKGVI